MRDLLGLVRNAFPENRIDPEKGRKDTEMRLAALTRLGAPQKVLESYRYPGVYCFLYDDLDAERQIECMVWPFQAIGVSFATEEHEREAFHLLERLATTLDYDFELDPDAA